MKSLARGLLSLSVASALVAPMSAMATNGYFMPGIGAKSLGMGGVGIAYAQDSLAPGANPAGLADVGTRADLGVGFFNPMRRSAVWDPPGGQGGFGFKGDSWSDNRLFLIPSAGFAMQWDDKLSFGIAAIAAGGMNTTYRDNFFTFGAPGTVSKTVGVDLMQLLVPVTVAYRANDQHAFGVSLVLARQRFAARGLEAFGLFPVPAYPNDLTNKGYAYANGHGWRLGWRGKFMEDDRLTLGATYATMVEMQRFDKYRGLFANEGSFDIPTNYGIGAAFKVTPKVTVAMDIVEIKYTSVPAVSNRGPNTVDIPSFTDPNAKTGLPMGMGFGWKDQTVYKIGADYKYDSKWTFRAGYNYGKSPIPNDQLTFNLLAPATVEKHFTVGFTYAPSDGSEWNVSFLHAKKNTQHECGLVMVDCATIEMYQNELDVAYAWKF